MENIEYIKLNINFNNNKKTVRIYFYLANDLYLKIFKYKHIEIFKLSREDKKVIIDYIEKLISSLKHVYYFNETKNFNFLLNSIIYKDIIQKIENNHYDQLFNK